MAMHDPHLIAVPSIADLLAVVPYLLRYHPQASVVAVALRDLDTLDTTPAGPPPAGALHAGRAGVKDLVFLARVDLPEAGAPDDEVRASLHAGAAAVAQHATEAVLIGYGPARRVEPVMDAADEVYHGHGVQLLDLLRVENNRYVSCRCQDPACCPPEGTVFDPSTSVAAVYATVAGTVALPDRDALAATIAAVHGADRARMREAMQRARDLLQTRAAAAATGRHDPRVAPTTTPGADRPGAPAGEPVAAVTAMARQVGQDAVMQAFDRYRHDGDTLTDDEAAWLILLLDYPTVRDVAAAHTTAGDDDVRLWTDLTRRAAPGLVRAPASLLAFTCWRAGAGTLARLALDRALADDPAYRLAHLLAYVVDNGIAPHTWPGPATTDSDDPPTAPPATHGRPHRSAPLSAARSGAPLADRPYPHGGGTCEARPTPAGSPHTVHPEEEPDR